MTNFYHPLINDEETLELISDYFLHIDDHYSRINVIIELKKVVLTDKCLIVFNKKSKNEVKSSSSDMISQYSTSSIPLMKYKSLSDGKIKAKYSDDGLVYLIVIRISNIHESHWKEPINLESEIVLACKRLPQTFNNKFKWMFFDDQSEKQNEITVGIVAK